MFPTLAYQAVSTQKCHHVLERAPGAKGLRFSLVALHGLPCSATRENLNKTLVKNGNPKFSYRNNENYQIHHGLFSNKHVELVYTKYEVKRSIFKEDGCIQPFWAQNPVFDTLTGDCRNICASMPKDTVVGVTQTVRVSLIISQS